MSIASKQNLNDYVAEQIRNKILSHEYKPQSKLPNEFELANEYNVCRYTVREAIKKLIATGLVSVERGRGTFVNEIVPATYFMPVIDKLILVERDVKEIFDARLAIEQKTAELAAINASKEDLKKMFGLLSEIEHALKNDEIQRINDLDLELHKAIAAASKNQILDIVLTTLHELIRFTILKTHINKEKYEYSFQGHKKIVDAIKENDPNEAREQMIHHLTYFKSLL